MTKSSKQKNCIRDIRNADGSVTFKVQLRLRGHAPIYKTFTRRTDAKRFVDEMKTEIRRGNTVTTEAERTTLKEALERYQREVTPKKKGRVREEGRIKAWLRHPLAVRFLSNLGHSSKDFAKYRDERLAKGKSESTVRSELMVISGLFKVARKEWGMCGLCNPIAEIAVPNPGRSNEPSRGWRASSVFLRRPGGLVDQLVGQAGVPTGMRFAPPRRSTWRAAPPAWGAARAAHPARPARPASTAGTGSGGRVGTAPARRVQPGAR
jgi:hypothetical protein